MVGCRRGIIVSIISNMSLRELTNRVYITSDSPTVTQSVVICNCLLFRYQFQ